MYNSSDKCEKNANERFKCVQFSQKLMNFFNSKTVLRGILSLTSQLEGKHLKVIRHFMVVKAASSVVRTSYRESEDSFSRKTTCTAIGAYSKELLNLEPN